MKLITLIALLFSFNLQAQTLVTIKPNDSKLASMQLEAKSSAKAIKKLKKIVLKSSWLKGDFSDSESGHIFSRDKSLGEEGRKEYFIPSNFTITVEDRSIAIAAAKDKADKKEAKRQALTDKLRESNLNLKEINAYLRGGLE